MKDQLHLLKTLNEIDLELDGLQAELAQIPVRERESELEVESKKNALGQNEQEAAGLQKRKADLEVELQALTDRMADFQTKLPLIKTHKEYQAALKEIDESKKMTREREDEILQLASRLEALETGRKECEEYVHGASVAHGERQKEHAAEREALMSRIGDLGIRREDTVPKIETRYQGLYQRIRKQRPDAVVAVLGGACQGCHMKISPQMRLEMQKGASLFSCPLCHRILYLHAS